MPAKNFPERLFVLWLAVGMSVCARTLAAQPGQHSRKSEETAVVRCDPRKTKFTPTIAADGPSEDRSTRLSYHRYETSKGLALGTVYGEFDSPAAATAELEYRAKSAVKIIVNGWQFDAKGDVVGRRVEALLPISRPINGSIFAVMWTSGRYFHEIQSTCKEFVLYAEKNAREGN